MTKILVFLILGHLPVYAQLDSVSHEALLETQRLLSQPGEREKAVAADPKASDVDKKVEALAGNAENKEEIYGLASKLMKKVAEESQGDPQKMQKLLEEAQKNPQAFYQKYFSSEEKVQVRELANKIEKQKISSGKAK